MNLLAVDIGNTDIKFGIFRNSVLHEQWRATGTRIHPEKFSALLRDSLARTGVVFSAIAYTSVVPDIEVVFRKTIQYCFSLPDSRIFAVDPEQIRLPVDFSHYASGQLGRDRLVNACCARLLYPETDLIVVDFGTATTFNLINSQGLYLGGAIAPGFATFANSLSEKTAQLPYILISEMQPERLAMGMDTRTCMEAGIGIGYRGLMKALLTEAEESLGYDNLKVIATGGLASSVLRICRLEERFQTVDPALTLKGLALLYEYNQRMAAAPVF